VKQIETSFGREQTGGGGDGGGGGGGGGALFFLLLSGSAAAVFSSPAVAVVFSFHLSAAASHGVAGSVEVDDGVVQEVGSGDVEGRRLDGEERSTSHGRGEESVR
jgi:hypothetical protein